MSAQVVIVTGCSKGLGQGVALRLAKDPQRRFKVYATMRNCADKQEDTVKKAGDYLNDTLLIRDLDVTKEDTIVKTINEIYAQEGKIDALVNNAATMIPTWWEKTPIDKSRLLMETNYFGCVRTTKSVAPFMKAKRSGKIIQISSLMGFKAMPYAEDYCATKFALEGFSESIAPLLRNFNVWVSLIEPGFMNTPMIQQFGKDSLDLYNAVLQSYEMSGVPEDDVKIVRDMMLNKTCGFAKELQDIDDVAKIIEEVIVSPQPDFRIQTSQTVKERAHQRFVDPAGNTDITLWQ